VTIPIITIMEIVALILASWPLARLWHSRNLAPLFPNQQRWLAGLLLGWLVALGSLAIWFPNLLHALTLIVLPVSVTLAWRARPNYGKSRGYPPGSLSQTQSVAAIADRNHYIDQATKYGPIFKMSQFHKPVVCIIGFEKGFRLFREHRKALGPSKLPFNQEVKGGFLRYMDDRVHSQYAPLFMKALAAKNLMGLTPWVSAICQQTLSRMSQDCADSAGGAVVPGAYCEQLAFDALAVTLFGLSQDMPEYHQMIKAYSGLRAYSLADPVSDETRQSLDLLRRFLSDYSAGLSEPGIFDGPSCTLLELHRIDSAMPDEVCIDNLLFIHKIASRNVADLLQWIFKMLGDNPEWMEPSRLDNGQASAMGMTAAADRIVDETLRLAQSEYLYRVLTKDVSFEGYTLPRGWLVRLCVWESHRSCPSFDQAEQFNPDRFAGREFSAHEYAPFGYGKHACNGAHLARLIAREFARILSSDFEYEVVDDGPVERDFRHWGHWRPSSNFKVKLTRKAPGKGSAIHPPEVVAPA